MAAIALIGILASLLSATWLHFNELQKLKAGQAEIYRAFRAARSNAIRDQDTWQVSIREAGSNPPRVQIALHKPETILNSPETLLWQELDSGVRLDSETSLPTRPLPPGNDYHYLLFNYTGCPASVVSHECLGVPPGRVTLSSDRQQSITGPKKMRRCVIISTILGVMRMSKEQPQPNEGNYCH